MWYLVQIHKTSAKHCRNIFSEHPDVGMYVQQMKIKAGVGVGVGWGYVTLLKHSDAEYMPERRKLPFLFLSVCALRPHTHLAVPAVYCPAVVHKPVYMHVHTELGNAGCMTQLFIFASGEEGAITHSQFGVTIVCECISEEFA
jgi:hypothetical protein